MACPKTIHLAKLDPAIEERLMNNPAYITAMMEENWGQIAELVHEQVGRTLNTTPVSIDTLAWDGYFVVDTKTREVVGSCAYKGPPSEDGTAEISYFTYPDFERKGYATAMAHKLIELATNSSEVTRVIAHTLPETSASTHVLKKASMNFVGEVTDPEDGLVWRWEIQVAS